MLDIALNGGAVVLVLAVFGVPLVLAVAPEPWRRWWPVSVPLYGLAGLAALQLPIGTLTSPGEAAVPVLVLALGATILTWRKFGGLPRPAIASLLTLLAVVPGGLLAYRPSLRLEEPRPSGVLNEDSIYYLGIDTWLQDHGIRDEPPSPDVDGFFATAHAAWENHLRIGVDLVNVQASTLLGVDPLETFPALTAALVGLVGLGSALAVISLRGALWTAPAAAFFVTIRPETVRLSLDSYAAQAAGVALVPVAASSLALALLVGTWRWTVTAGLFAATLTAYYVEYAPWLALTGILMAVALVLRPAWIAAATTDIPRARALVVRRSLAVAAWAVFLNPLAAYNGLRSLSAGSKLSGETVVPFYGLLRDLSLVTGPFSVLYTAPEASLFLGVAVLVILVAAMPHMSPGTAISTGATLVATALFALHQAYVQDYSYGVYKVLGIAAPLAAIGLLGTIAMKRMPLGIRGVAAAVAGLLLIVNATATSDVSRLSVDAVNGMVPDDRRLLGVSRILPGVEEVALEGTDAAGTPNARQHYGLYFLRKYNDLEVTYARGPGSYYATELQAGRADVDRTYSPDYGAVISWGPSLTQTQQVGQLGGWHVYRRPRGPNLLLVGREGWNFPTSGPDGRPLRWTRGPAFAWLNAERPAEVRLKLELAAPFGAQRLRLRIGDRRVLSRVVSPAVTSMHTETFRVPRGQTVIGFDSEMRRASTGGDPLGVGLLSASVEIIR